MSALPPDDYERKIYRPNHLFLPSVSDLKMSDETANSALIRRRVLISGRVQGVWFRDSCCEQARENRVFGWIRNTPDDAVEAVFEGATADVERLIEWSKRGPSQAVVDSVEVAIEEPEGLSAFWIK